MKFRGLKISIATDLAIVLTVGMLLVNFVTLSLWRQFMISYEIDKAKEMMSIISNPEIHECKALSDLILKSDQFTLSSEAYNLFYVDNTVIGKSDTIAEKAKKILALSAHSNTQLIKTYGSIWSILGLSTKEILVTQPITGCSGNAALGTYINMASIYSQILQKQSYVLVYILVNVIILSTIGFFRMRKTVVRPLEDLVQLSETYRGSDDLLSLSSSKSEFNQVALSLHSMISLIENDKE